MKPILDIDGKEVELGHIVAVRYVWNSYVGIVRIGGLSLHEGALRHCGAASFHSLEHDKTYQILGHITPGHKDYNKDVITWHNSEHGICPIRIRVYDNI